MPSQEAQEIVTGIETAMRDSPLDCDWRVEAPVESDLAGKVLDILKVALPPAYAPSFDGEAFIVRDQDNDNFNVAPPADVKIFALQFLGEDKHRIADIDIAGKFEPFISPAFRTAGEAYQNAFSTLGEMIKKATDQQLDSISSAEVAPAVKSITTVDGLEVFCPFIKVSSPFNNGSHDFGRITTDTAGRPLAVSFMRGNSLQPPYDAPELSMSIDLRFPDLRIYSHKG